VLDRDRAGRCGALERAGVDDGIDLLGEIAFEDRRELDLDRPVIGSPVSGSIPSVTIRSPSSSISTVAPACSGPDGIIAAWSMI